MEFERGFSVPRYVSLFTFDFFKVVSGGSRICQPLNLGQKPIICQDFCRKLHENERNWTERGASLASPLDPPMVFVSVLRETLD